MRTAKFIASKNWFVAGSDDGFIRVYNYETMEKIIEFEAHTDYIRSVAIHPNLPCLISVSDDKFVKLWDWEKVGNALMFLRHIPIMLCKWPLIQRTLVFSRRPHLMEPLWYCLTDYSIYISFVFVWSHGME